MIKMVRKKTTKNKAGRKPSKYNVLITVKTIVTNKAKALKMKRDAHKKLKGSKVKLTKVR